MPRALGPADSFNSSGATIVPDRSARSSRRKESNSHNVSSLSSARVLMPQDTLGRELDEAMASSQESRNSQEWDIMAALDQFTRNPNEPSRQPSLTFPDNTDFHALLSPPTAATSTLPQTQPYFNPLLSNYPDPTLLAQSSRPSSVHSHRSSISGSEFSYTTTEVDEDDAMDGVLDSHKAGPSFPGKWEMRDDSTSPYPTPGPSDGVSPDTVPGSVAGPWAKAAGEAETPEQRKQRLEHRRSINRKSAQKHRLRRKEELETLSRKVAEKDVQITRLQQDLAVANAKINQLVSFIKLGMENSSGGGKSASQGDGAGRGKNGHEAKR